MWISMLLLTSKNRLSRASIALLMGGTMFQGCLTSDLGQTVRTAAAGSVETGLDALLADDQEAAGQAFGSAIVDGLVELVTPQATTTN